MDFRETIREVFDTFFVIFTCAIVGLTIYLHVLGNDFAFLRDIVAIFIISILGALASIVLYSKEELPRSKLIIRYAAHTLVIVGIILSTASYMGWIIWSEPITVIRFMVLVLGIFVAVHASIYYSTRKLADKLNEKLKERYK
jgi:hypothetical protein